MELGEQAPLQNKDMFRTESPPYEEVFQWGDDDVTVVCSPQEIIRSLTKRLSSEQKATMQKTADIQFFFDAKSLKQELEKNPQSPETNRILRVLDSSIDAIDSIFTLPEFGAMYADTDTTPYRLFLNVPKLVRAYSSSSPLMRFMRPMNQWTDAHTASKEAKIQTLKTALTMELNHETEHILQMMDPEERAKIEKSMQTTHTIKRTALTGFISGAGGMAANQMLLSNGVYSSALPTAASALALGGLIFYTATEGFSGTLSSHEKDAQKAEFQQSDLSSSPFTISVKDHAKF